MLSRGSVTMEEIRGDPPRPRPMSIRRFALIERSVLAIHRREQLIATRLARMSQESLDKLNV